MKCKYYLCMMLFSFMVLFHQYSLVKADETESTLTQKYFKVNGMKKMALYIGIPRKIIMQLLLL